MRPAPTPPTRRAPRPGRPGRRRRWLLLRHESGVLLRMAGPIVLSQLGGVGMNTMDTIMVGPLGEEALAAAGLSSALHTTMLMVCTGTLLGMAPLVSQAFGAGRRLECREVLVQGLWLALALTLPMTALNLVGEPAALLLGQAPEVASLAGGYMGALAWGVLPLLLFTALRQFLEGMGLTRPAMVITFLGLGLNYLGNRVLIHGVAGWVEPLGVVGSGWATTLVRWAMLLAMAFYILRHPDLHPFRGIARAPDAPRLRRIVGVGAPTGAQAGMEVGLFASAAVMMGWFGALELATHQVTINIASATFMVALGVSIAGSIRVGQTIGAGDAAGMRRAVLLTYLYSLAVMALCAAIFLRLPEALVRLYTDVPAVIELGRSLLLMAAIFQLFDGAQVAGFAVLRGAADTRRPMLIAALAYWVLGMPAAYLLGFHSPLGPVGIWAGLCVGLAVASLLLLARVRRVLWIRPPVRPRRAEAAPFPGPPRSVSDA